MTAPTPDRPDVVEVIATALWALTDALSVSDGSEVDSIAGDFLAALRGAGWVLVRALPAAGLLRSDLGGTETEVEWRVVNKHADSHCGDDEKMARSLAARFSGKVQSRPSGPWRDA